MTHESLSPTFKNHLTLSLLLHLAVIAFFSIKAYWFPAEPIIIQQAIRVDMVGLPDKFSRGNPTQAAVKPSPAPPSVPKIEPKTEEKAQVTPTSLKPKKSAKEIREEAMRRIEAIEKLRDETPSKAPQATTMGEVVNKLSDTALKTFKGNVVSEGDASTGISQIRREHYAGTVAAHIKRLWFLPKWLEEAQLSAEVLIKIDERGLITLKQFAKSSGDQTFDGLVLSTIEKASPLPPPPRELVDFYEHQGMILIFP